MSSTEGRTLRSSTSASKRKSTDASGVGRDDQEEKIAAVGGGGDEPRPADCWSANDFRPNQRVKVYYAEGVFKATYLGHDDNGKVCVVFDGFDDQQWELDGDEGLVLIDADNDNDEDEDANNDVFSESNINVKRTKIASVLNVNFVPEPQNFFTQLLLSNVKHVMSSTASEIVAATFGTSTSTFFDAGLEERARTKLLNSPLDLYNRKVNGKVPALFLSILRQGLGYASQGSLGPSIVILNSELLTTSVTDPQPGSKSYNFVVQAWGATKGAKTVQNEVNMLHALSPTSQSLFSHGNIFQWVLTNEDTATVKHKFGRGSPEFEAGKATFSYLVEQGIKIFIGRGKTIAFYAELTKYLVAQEGYELGEIVASEKTPLGPVDLKVSILCSKDGQVIHLLSTRAHGSQMHDEKEHPTILGQYAYAARAVGNPLSKLEYMNLGKALVDIRGTSYINGDERKKLHEEGYIVKTGPNKGNPIKSYKQLGT